MTQTFKCLSDPDVLHEMAYDLLEDKADKKKVRCENWELNNIFVQCVLAS